MFNIAPRFIPYIIGSIVFVVCVGGAGLWGFMQGSAKARAEIARYERRIAEQNAEIAEQNTILSNVVTAEFVDKLNIIKDTEYVYIEIASDVVPSQYNLSNGWVYTHDAAATARIPDPTRSADATPSTFRDNQALRTVVRNYSTCQATAAQLEALQKWVRETRAQLENR